jgi:hypothetical protein
LVAKTGWSRGAIDSKSEQARHADVNDEVTESRDDKTTRYDSMNAAEVPEV